MGPPILNLSPCQYLFGREAEEVFPQTMKRFSKQLINEALATLMKVSAYLITKKEALILFDPTAFNNQCHLYAMMTVQIVKNAKEIDERFIHLSFLLGYSILTDASLLGKIVKKVPKEIMGDIPHPEKEFEILIKDPTGERTRASRLSLNKLFKDYIYSSFSSENMPVYKELFRLANDPQLFVSYGPEKLYTLPKFAGVVYLIDTIARQQIPLIFKVKVLTNEGTGFFQHSDRKSGNAAIVFEMIAYDDAFTRELCLDITKRCPRNSERDVSRKKRHDEKETCCFCTSLKVDIAPYQTRYLPILKAASEMLYALGVAFIQERQPQFLKFFSDSKEFPILAEMFRYHAPNVDKLGLASTKASNIYVSHVFVDSAPFAEQDSMIMDAPYESHLSERGLI